MKIIYRQPETGSVLERAGVKNCCFKQISFEKDWKQTNKRDHYHTSYELHIMEKGHQEYSVDGNTTKLESGHFLLIPPKVMHYAVSSSPFATKISLTFNFSGEIRLFSGATDELIADDINIIAKELEKNDFLSCSLIENRIFELLAGIMRICGYKFGDGGKSIDESSADMRLGMAKQYIDDNIELNPRVSDVADFCYLSTRQLTRIFREKEQITPAAYIKKKQIAYFENLLCKSEFSIREIAEKMNFSSEYTFNSFFKSFAGMPPGEYRKMTK